MRTKREAIWLRCSRITSVEAAPLKVSQVPGQWGEELVYGTKHKNWEAEEIFYIIKKLKNTNVQASKCSILKECWWLKFEACPKYLMYHYYTYELNIARLAIVSEFI